MHQETLGTGLRCFNRAVDKLDKYFTHVTKKKWPNRTTYYQKTQQYHQGKKKPRRTTSAIWRAFAVLNNRLSPKRVDKQAIEDVLNIDGGKHDLACL